jgi:TonB family protein
MARVVLAACLILLAAAWPGRQRAACAQEPAAATQSPELAEADRLGAQVVELYARRKFDEALPLAERALALREKALGPDHALVGDALGNVAELLYMMRKHKEAEAAFRRQSAIYEKSPGQVGARASGALHRYVCLLNDRERWDDLLAAQKRLFRLDNGFEFDASMTDRPEKNQARAGLIAGRVKVSPAPRYPAAARDARVTGAVVMKITVDEAGGVAAVKALCGPPPLIQSAVEAVSKARYEPLAVGGKAVPFTGVVIYRYTLQ